MKNHRKIREVVFFFLGVGMCGLFWLFSGPLAYVFLLTGCYILFVPRNSAIPVLAYHSIHPNPLWMGAPDLVVSPSLFARQVAALTKIGWKTVWMDELLDIRTRKLTGRYIAIHFDDNYRDCLTNALPVLQRYNAKGTLFVSPGLLQDAPGVDGLPRSSVELPPEVFLSSADLVTLSSTDTIEIQSHAWTHRELAQLSAEEIEMELVASRQWLSEAIGKPVSHICFPRDSCSAEVIAISRSAGYRSHTAGVDNNDRKSAPETVSRMYVTESGHAALDMAVFFLDILLFKCVYAVWPVRALGKRLVWYSWCARPQARRTP